MKTDNIIRQIDDNQAKIAGYGKFEENILKKINYKFRLDWNYFSNRMEGGTLTREETRSVMVGNIDVKGKPLKDVMEMNGHDRMVLDILKMGKGEQRISEKRIKEIHKAIMHEDDPEKVDWIGNWKTVDNHVINYKGEKIAFASPLDVPEKLHDLLGKTNAELDKYFNGKSSRHPLEIAAKFHIDFVTIHPFYDGNGRTTRILTNLILISCGLPPIVIKDQHKQAYYQLLADVQVYGGNEGLFITFVGERILESQELVISALDGNDIEEPDDIDKEIDLFIKKMNKEESETVKKTEELIVQVYEHSLKPLFTEFLERHSKFDKLFDQKKIRSTINNEPGFDGVEYFDEWVDYFTQKNEIVFDTDKMSLFEIDMLSEFDPNAESREYNFHKLSGIDKMELLISYEGFKQNGVNAFDISSGLNVVFNPYSYVIYDRKSKRGEDYIQKLYSQALTQAEINTIVKELLRETLTKIQDALK